MMKLGENATLSTWGTAKNRIELEEEGKYCLDWFMCFKKDK